MRAALPMLLLAACAAPADAAGLPSRADIGSALLRWSHCIGPEQVPPDTDITCPGPARRIAVSWLRCRAESARVLCRFSSVVERRRGGPVRRGPECAYLHRGDDGEWWLDSWPDADLCRS